ncbi:MAG: PQQ-like beta-propeller repeat protein [Candidatus Omnitrophica bacterium]|nr:PQQ-like beta-propeller repeat protein [Candidatus Omnitrophota bacterium]
MAISPLGFCQGLNNLNKENQSLFSHQEEVLVDNYPVGFKRPFYENNQDKPYLTQLNAKSEHLYFTNIKAEKQKRTLISKDGILYFNPDIRGLKTKVNWKMPAILSREGPLEVGWSYDFKFDTTTHYYSDSRQWLKRYQEPLVEPLLGSSSVFVRDEYFIRCLDRETGREKWKIGFDDPSRPDLYQTFHPPHQNAYGFVLTGEDKMIFAELFGRLVAVSTADDEPIKVWQKTLGEFRTVTKPVVFGQCLVAAVINSTGELWVMGFSLFSGEVLWTEYVGLTSFLSPLSAQTLKDSSYVYFATNHGVLIAVDPQKGVLAWVRKFETNKYSAIKYWTEKKYLDPFTKEGSIPFSGSALTVNQEGLIVHKPRESSCIYTVEPKTGELAGEFCFNQNRYTFLGMLGDDSVFYKELPQGQAKIIVIDCLTQKPLFEKLISQGKVYGAKPAGANAIFFKVEGRIYSLEYKDDSYCFLKEIDNVGGWLIYADFSGTLFLLNQNKLLCLGAGSSGSPNGDKGQNTLKINNFIKSCLNQMISGEDFSKKLADFREKNIISRREFLKQAAAFGGIFAGGEDSVLVKMLSREFKDSFLNYKDISIRAPAYFKAITGQRASRRPKSCASGSAPETAYTVRGEYLYLLPVERIGNGNKNDFYFLLNYDQLICAEEDGRIRWSAQIFYHHNPNSPYGVNVHGDLSRSRAYADNIRAYLIGDVVIVNDSVNICAFDLCSGSLRWSMTTADESFHKARVMPFEDDSLLFKEKGISRLFLDNIEKKIKFVNKKPFIIYRNSIYRIDPLTGFCDKKNKLGVKSFISVTADNNLIYLVDSDMEKLLLVNQDCELIDTIELNFLSKEDIYAELQVSEVYIYIKTNDNIYAINKNTSAQSNLAILEKGERGLWEWVVNKDIVCVILPMDSITAYSVQSGRFIKKWEVKNDFSKQKLMATDKEPAGEQSAFFYARKDIIYFFQNRGDSFYLSAYDIPSGKQFWDTRIFGSGLFYNLSPAIFDKDFQKLIFIFSRNVFGHDQSEILQPENCSNHIRSWLVSLDYRDGSNIQYLELPRISGYKRGFERVTIAQTDKIQAYTIHGNFLVVEPRPGDNYD